MYSVYKLFDSEMNLLYVGATQNISTRCNWHKNNQPWSDKVVWALTETILQPDKAAALILESKLINDLKPKHNKTYIGEKKEPRSLEWVKQTIRNIVKHSTHRGVTDYRSAYPDICRAAFEEIGLPPDIMISCNLIVDPLTKEPMNYTQLWEHYKRLGYQLFRTDKPQKQIAIDFGYHYSYISLLKNGKRLPFLREMYS